ncbi:hypothetical protein [Alicyclobacillus mengziensis]|uniref:Uncharacterized protein n=1 Tax=Alicyclobacillus mengziensis TaxID=2931921 RepID=A0A9X7VWP1_9BACL|nr:hypothetical protein [Alicyclobacillus mengziensis]QSO45960.1 hypothetical protein JZ786_15640 [Alicyclobacillus mengziensis]
MNHSLPDWMFAAFAIGAWTVGGWVNTHWHLPQARWVAGAVVLICVITLGVRYLLRLIRRMKSPGVEDPDEWKNY